ncbi:MAG: beta-galactosidase [Tissierellia bacterium]|nr:beta-galactosidase [Tissierellia bacterium]MDD4781024.1 beta-galactosidase [Tissierellia bacterium]
MLNSCLVDVVDEKEIIIDAKDIYEFTRTLDLNQYPSIKDTVEVPITAWFGIPNSSLNLKNFQEMKDAGFNINYYRYANADTLQKALDLSQAVGIKTLINTSSFHENPEPIVERFKNHPANAGYFIRDEPPVSMIPQLLNTIQKIELIDPSKMFYVNLLPSFATTSTMGTDYYRDYVTRFINELPLDIISFDFYPIVTNRSQVQYGWYNNLEMIREESEYHNKPFWAFALTTSHGEYPIPTLEHLRLQVYMNLAYGAKGIQYYTYWTTTSPNFVYVSGPIEKDGSKTKVYDLVKQVNEEINTLSYIFLSSKVTDIAHYGSSIPDGTRRLNGLPNYIESMKIEGNCAVFSEMKNKDNTFFMIQNNDLHNPIGVTLKTDTYTNIVLKNGKIIPASLLKDEIRIDSGDVLILMR